MSIFPYSSEGDMRYCGGRKGGVGSGVFLGECKGGNLPASQAGQEAFLLLFRPEEEERLRDTDGLVGRDQRRQTAAVTAEEAVSFFTSFKPPSIALLKTI